MLINLQALNKIMHVMLRPIPAQPGIILPINSIQYDNSMSSCKPVIPTRI